jgi:hypothetical protein
VSQQEGESIYGIERSYDGNGCGPSIFQEKEAKTVAKKAKKKKGK